MGLATRPLELTDLNQIELNDKVRLEFVEIKHV